MATGYAPRLLTLLGDPVVSYNLQQKRLDSESKRTIDSIMVDTAVSVRPLGGVCCSVEWCGEVSLWLPAAVGV